MTAEIDGPHNGQPVLALGAPLEEASAALLLVHGRGASAEDILSLTVELDDDSRFIYLAPQAAGHTWYPYSFLSPIAQNEPYLTSALLLLESILEEVGKYIPPERTILGGFSQGACLASEYTARHARRYGGLVAFSGGLIGPDGTPRDYAGSLDGTPVFLGCSDRDPHIPKERVLETERVLRDLGGDVTARLYPNMGHTVSVEEIGYLKKMIAAIR